MSQTKEKFFSYIKLKLVNNELDDKEIVFLAVKNQLGSSSLVVKD